MMVELADVPVQSLVPEPLRTVATADEFMAALPQYDGDMAAQLEEAQAAGECLRFVGASLFWLLILVPAGPSQACQPLCMLRVNNCTDCSFEDFPHSSLGHLQQLYVQRALPAPSSTARVVQGPVQQAGCSSKEGGLGV
jgi:hypothetical protein